MNRILIALLFALCFTPLSAQHEFNGHWKGELIRNGFIWNTEIRIGTQTDGQPEIRVSFPDFGMFRLPTGEISMDENSLSLKVLWFNMPLELTLSDQLITTSIPGNTTISGKFHKISDDPAFFRREIVSVETDDGIELKGTVVYPNSEGPFKGMVLTHGSGPDTRITAPYISKAHLAVESGLAVLIYDKRGAGESGGGGYSNLERLSRDAHHMVEALKNQNNILYNYVGIGGISQGGWVAPKVAYEDTTIAFLFTTATPGVTPAEQNVYTLETRIENKSEREFAVRALRTLYEFYRTNDPVIRKQAVDMINNPKYSLRQNEMFLRLMFISDHTVPDTADTGFWSQALFTDPLPWWQVINIPAIALSGRDDANVPTVFSKKLIEAAQEKAGNSDYQYILFDNAGHGLTLENGAEGDWARAAIGYVETMRSWFEDRAQD